MSKINRYIYMPPYSFLQSINNDLQKNCSEIQFATLNTQFFIENLREKKHPSHLLIAFT